MDAKTIELTAEITAAYVSNNTVPVEGVAGLISSIFSALTQTEAPPEAPAAALAPAVPIRRSVQPDFIVCLEDGKQFKSLKRHLQTKYGLTPEAYREKWGLPSTYPMVAPNYAAARSALAKASGLGAGGRAPQAAAAPVAVIADAPAKAPRVTKAKRSAKALDPAADDFT